VHGGAIYVEIDPVADFGRWGSFHRFYKRVPIGVFGEVEEGFADEGGRGLDDDVCRDCFGKEARHRQEVTVERVVLVGGVTQFKSAR
jgi:hypothetical protein